MGNQWKITDNILHYTNSQNVEIFPRAVDIFSAAFGNGNIEWLSEIRHDLPDLRFSKISSLVIAHFWLADERINFELIIRRKGASISVQADRVITDHYIHNNTWFYLSNVSPELQKCIERWVTDGTSLISIGQYVNLLQEIRAKNLVEIVDDASAYLANKKITHTPIPTDVRATLYPYQEDGFRWLDFMVRENCGCILGDEMGLGKTLQIIALITKLLKHSNQHYLVVSPVTLLENWRREFEKFSPSIKVLVHHGTKRSGRYKDFLLYDVVVISYGTAVSDIAMLNMLKWDLVVLDEAQNIKNPEASRTKAVKRLNRRVGIAVTGTPFENHMTDLWSLMDFITPGLLGTLSEFNGAFSDDSEGATRIEPLLSPLMIRRRVADVAKDLPDRLDIPEVLRMDDQESLIYESERSRILEALGGKGATLAALQKLRMFCTHPFLIQESRHHGDPAKFSLKYRRFCEILEEITSKQAKVILFTSYTEMFSILLEDIPNRFGIPVYAINGNTPPEDRQPTVDIFSACPGAALLILNPRAAGTGLNITAANYVIHYNLEWNPALEDQASARSYRRGQKKKVFVYRLYYADTVEQVVNKRVELKRDLSGIAVTGISGKQENRNDILTALMMSPKEVNT